MCTFASLKENNAVAQTVALNAIMGWSDIVLTGLGGDMNDTPAAY